MADDIVTQLLRVATIAEDRGLHEVSAEIAGILREINAAPAAKSGVSIENWPDFSRWWESNRGQNLEFIFVDTYGEDSEEVKLVRELLKKADEYEKTLHGFYMTLKNKQQQNATPEAGSAPAAEPAKAEEPKAEEKEEKKDDTEEKDDGEADEADLDSLGD